MILTNKVTVAAPPAEVFALINDVERVASCMPGATLDGKDGDAYLGRVKVKVGPISAAYAGSIRFLEVDDAARRLSLKATGADTHGGGDAEAAVSVLVAEAPGGSVLSLETDLVITGKIVAFGKGAITSVSDKLLQQFAGNLAGLLEASTDTPSAPSAVTVTRAESLAPLPDELDGLAMLLGPNATKYAGQAALFAAGVFQGWLLSRAFGRCHK